MKVVLACHRAMLLLAAALMIPAIARADEEALVRAKALYVSAAYDEALAALENVPVASAADAKIAAEYRVFCLLALDRKVDARRAIESMLAADPFHRLPEGQTSPRIRAVFDDIRRQIFPGLVQRAYSDAKAAFDQKDAAAAAGFERVLALLDDPDGRTIPEAADLRTVVRGFRDLSAAAAMSKAPVISAAPVSPASAGGPPAAAPITSAKAAAGATVQPAAAPQVPGSGSGLVPPVAVFQRLPEWRPFSTLEQRRQFSGTLELMIDASGNVTSAKMRQSITPRYDAELLRAAMTWRFQPATLNGVPTTYLKTVDIQLQPK